MLALISTLEPLRNGVLDHFIVVVTSAYHMSLMCLMMICSTAVMAQWRSVCSCRELELSGGRWLKADGMFEEDGLFIDSLFNFIWVRNNPPSGS